jgi:hypothetical protein
MSEHGKARAQIILAKWAQLTTYLQSGRAWESINEHEQSSHGLPRTGLGPGVSQTAGRGKP